MAGDTPEFTWIVEKGEAESMTFPVALGGTPLDLTGWTVDAKVKVNPGGPVLYTFLPEHIEIGGDDSNEVTLRVPESVSDEWDFSVAYYRVRVVDPEAPIDAPVSYRVLQGPLLVDSG